MMRVLNNFGADAFVALVFEEVDDIVARRHGSGNRPVFKREDVFDHAPLFRINHTFLDARVYGREDVCRRDAFTGVRRHAEFLHRESGAAVQSPDNRFQNRVQPGDRADHEDRARLRTRHRVAARDQVSEENEEEGSGEIREPEGCGVSGGFAEHVNECRFVERDENILPKNTAGKSEGINADLDDRKHRSGISLKRNNFPGALVACFGEPLKPHILCGGE